MNQLQGLGYTREGYRNPVPTTDLIIEYVMNEKKGIILIERKNFPYGLALPGGFAEWGISLEENAKKEGMEETGLAFIIDNPEQPLCVLSDPHRDPRGHMISITYVGTGIGTIKAGDDAKKAHHVPYDILPKVLRDCSWAFPDHRTIVERYLKQKGFKK